MVNHDLLHIIYAEDLRHCISNENVFSDMEILTPQAGRLPKFCAETRLAARARRDSVRCISKMLRTRGSVGEAAGVLIWVKGRMAEEDRG